MHTPPHKIGRRLLTVRQLAGKVGKSVSSVWAGVADGTIPRGFKVGGATRWDEAEIDGWFDQLLSERDAQAGKAAQSVAFGADEGA